MGVMSSGSDQLGAGPVYNYGTSAEGLVYCLCIFSVLSILALYYSTMYFSSCPWVIIIVFGLKDTFRQ